MPEGHLIRWLARRHDAALSGGAVRTSSPQGRFAAEAAVLDGRVLSEVSSYGKHLFYRWDAATIAHVHLGQAGTFLEWEHPSPEPRPQVRLRMSGDAAVLDLIAPTTCRIISEGDRASVLARLGPDPLQAGVDPAPALERLAKSGRPIGALLMDQSVIAGVGNVLRAEVLHMHAIHPARPGSSLGPDELTAIWKTLVDVMARSAEAGRIITARGAPGVSADAAAGEPRFVYKQDHCLRCGTRVDRWTMAARTAYACPTCQPAVA